MTESTIGGMQPEQFAIIADMIGSNINPKGAFAGVGQALGQSGLANKEVKRQDENMLDMIRALTGKDQPGPSDLRIASDGKGGLTYASTGNILGLDKSPALDTKGSFTPDYTSPVSAPSSSFTADNDPNSRSGELDNLIQELGLKPL
jgi:hypothetical protein